MSDVHKEGCSLAWNPPTDDGGAEISHYVVEKEDVATGHWVPVSLRNRSNFVYSFEP